MGSAADPCMTMRPWRGVVNESHRSAGARTAGEYFDVFFETPCSQEMEFPESPQRFTRRLRRQ